MRLEARTGLSIVIWASLVGCGAERDTEDSNPRSFDSILVDSTLSGAPETNANEPASQGESLNPAGSEESSVEQNGSFEEGGSLGENTQLVDPQQGSEGNVNPRQGAVANELEEEEADGATIGELPLVYGDEDTGAGCPAPALPPFDQLPSITGLPDPFVMSSGERISSRADWRCRRAEIQSVLEEYDVGEKPGKPSTVEAVLDGNTIRVNVSEGGSSFEMTATLSRPANAAEGPIPAIIGINAPTGSLPASVFSSRGIATITYDANQVAPTSFGNNPRSAGSFFEMYPGATAGYMIRWAWGVSRIIDALEQLPEANIDLQHLAVSGCSFQGKIALYAGAFDERIALTIPHESGGGGTISWRYSDMLEKRDNTEVENLLHAQGAPWYAEALRQFNNDPDRLPFDHHELMAMAAPRALLAIESTATARMGAEAARVSALAAREVWSALGVPDRMGVAEENVNHCVWHDGFTADLEAYVDKFLLSRQDVDTDIIRSRFEIDTDTWIPWETPALE